MIFKICSTESKDNFVTYAMENFYIPEERENFESPIKNKKETSIAEVLKEEYNFDAEFAAYADSIYIKMGKPLKRGDNRKKMLMVISYFTYIALRRPYTVKMIEDKFGQKSQLVVSLKSYSPLQTNYDPPQIAIKENVMLNIRGLCMLLNIEEALTATIVVNSAELIEKVDNNILQKMEVIDIAAVMVKFVANAYCGYQITDVMLEHVCNRKIINVKRCHDVLAGLNIVE